MRRRRIIGLGSVLAASAVLAGGAYWHRAGDGAPPAAAGHQATAAGTAAAGRVAQASATPQGNVPLSFSYPATKLPSLAEARAATSFPLLAPTSIPAEFQLETIERFAPTDPRGPWLERVRIWYRAPDERYLLMEQGSSMTADEAAYRLAPADQKGSATVQGQPALWSRGTASGNAMQTPQWQPGPIALRWQTGTATNGAPLGVALESDTLTLEELVVIAHSVKPYP